MPEAFVELEVAATDIAAETLRNQLAPLLAAFKIPRRIHKVDRLPRGKSGKVLKSKLNE